ncbi:MAG: hypothetical protein V1804_01080 [Patescibacteria group bacterium]
MEEYNIGPKESRATVSSTGGIATRFAVEGRNVFYPWRMIGNKSRGGCPICAPWFGSSPRGLKKHGFLRDMESEAGSIGRNEVKFSFRHGQMQGYPWSMRYETGAKVSEDGVLTMSLGIRRLDDGIDGKASVLPGFHPYLEGDSSEAEVYVGSKEFKGFAEESRMIPLTNRLITIVIPGPSERIIKMELGGDFFRYGQPQMVFWSDSPREYFCVEPILYAKDLFDTPKGYGLEKNQEMNLSVSFKVI